ncbi:hypothetical protein O3P16_14485 [Chitinophagaceae bacterium LY-5]|uniref:Toxin-antitoxin system YwqK family antitoxin n=2 Tax=Polluticaenibacter yanchengensis TaxID=3014562 RepID=A0ABT4UN24_9BACT|nr:hypothetical protein [Chitinophagaceae bacterium LY-5]
MKFSIDNGTNICSIGMSNIGSYIRFNYPLTVVWDDSAGSIDRYFCLLPYNEEYRNTIRSKINENLNQDFTGNINGLYELLKPLLPIFKNGDYYLSFSLNKGMAFKPSYDSLDIIFAERTTEISKIELIKNEHQFFLKENQVSKKYYDSNLLEYSTEAFYNGRGYLFATQPLDNIDQNRVRYYEEKIRNGERPFAIIFSANLHSEDLESSDYILDGHHKLLAYKILGIYPPEAVITYLPKLDEVEFDAEKLSEVLYPWQVEHILEYWEGKDEYIERTLKNPNSNLHSIIKNGNVFDYHENGKLKHKAFYINDKVDGVSMHWYDNGQLKCEHYYKKGIRIGTWKDYYPSGKISFVQPFNDYGMPNGIVVSYFENGNKRFERVLENGINKDGVSSRDWFENGSIAGEVTYRNHQIVVRKNWSGGGVLINHEIFNEETRKMDSIDIKPNEKKLHSFKQVEMLQTINKSQYVNKESGFWIKIRSWFR